MENYVVTIARQYGSGGRTVGQMLAERLGISYYDKEIVHMASDESGIDVKLFGQVEGGASVRPSIFSKSGLYKGGLIPPGRGNLFQMRTFLIIRQRLSMTLPKKSRMLW